MMDSPRATEYIKSVKFMMDAGAKLNETTIPRLLDMSKHVQNSNEPFKNLVQLFQSAVDATYNASILDKMPDRVNAIVEKAKESIEW